MRIQSHIILICFFAISSIGMAQTIYEGGSGGGSGSTSMMYSSASLPLSLLEFVVSEQGDHREVRWRTATHQVPTAYTVERSADGTHFTVLATVDAPDNHSDDSYTFLDLEPVTGTVYYRLRATLEGGAYDFSRIESISIQPVDWSFLLLYTGIGEVPLLRFSGVGSTKEPISVLVYTTDGQLALRTRTTLTDRRVRIVGMDKLTNGLYYVRAEGANGHYCTRSLRLNR